MEWNRITLGEAYDQEGGVVQTGPFGSQLHESDYKDEGVPVVMPKDITDDKISYSSIARVDESDANRLGRHKLELNDIVFPRRGDIGKRALVTAEQVGWLCGTGCLKLRGTSKLVHPKFLYYYLKQKSVVAWIENQAIGATMMNLNTSILRSVPLELPPYHIQTRITSVLSAFDELIDNNSQRITLLEQMAEGIYKEWFVRLRFAGHENIPVVDGLPQGWEVNTLDNYLKYYRGKSYSSDELTDSTGLPLLNLKCINRGGGFRRDGLKYFDGKFTINNVAYTGDIVMAVTDMTQNRDIVGRVALIPDMGFDKYIFSMDLIRLEPVGLSKTFLYSLLRYSGIGLELKEFANGANVLHLTPSVLDSQLVTMPAEAVRTNFEKIVAPMLKEIDLLELKNENLKQTRDLLLPRLISGKLSIEHLAEHQLQLAI